MQQEHIITAEDLREYLSKQDNFVLELFVYEKAREHGFRATHGGTYTDPVTKKPRQYDVRAALQREYYRVELAIECKCLQPTYPLLLSRIPRAPSESFHQLVYYDIESASRASAVASFLDYAKVVRHVGTHSIYRSREFVAKTLTQVGRNNQGNLKSGDDGVYDKWSQALASADELIALAEGGHNTKKLLTFIVPVLVVSDEMLWVADYSENGEKANDPVQCDESMLFVGRDYGGPMRIPYTISHLHIVTKRHVGPFFKRFTDKDYLQQIFQVGRWGMSGG